MRLEFSSRPDGGVTLTVESEDWSPEAEVGVWLAAFDASLARLLVPDDTTESGERIVSWAGDEIRRGLRAQDDQTETERAGGDP